MVRSPGFDQQHEHKTLGSLLGSILSVNSRKVKRKATCNDCPKAENKKTMRKVSFVRAM